VSALAVFVGRDACRLGIAPFGGHSSGAIPRNNTRHRALQLTVLVLPGLLGALVLALLVVGLFQLPGLRWLYDTPVPLVAGLVLLLAPLALLLRWLVRATEHGSALHLARMAKDRELIWELSTKRKFWVVVLLFCWGYFDLTASAILAPVGMTPVFVRLHNLMHYGQSAVLSAMVLAAFAVPVALVLVAGGGRKLWHE
jgi:hypothetical protein